MMPVKPNAAGQKIEQVKKQIAQKGEKNHVA
jgi:hypothetical protein